MLILMTWFIKCLTLAFIVVLFLPPLLVPLIKEHAIASKTGNQLFRFCMCFQRRLLFIFWSTYLLLTFIPQVVVVILMTFYWLCRFYALAWKCPNAPETGASKLSVWENQPPTYPCLSVASLKLVGVRKVQALGEYEGVHSLTPPGVNECWLVKGFGYSLHGAKLGALSFVGWFLSFLYADLFLLNFRRTFRLVLIVWPKFQRVQWVSFWPEKNLWYSDRFSHPRYSTVPSFNVFRRAYHLTCSLIVLHPLLTSREFLNLNLNYKLLSVYVIGLVLDTSPDPASNAYKLVVVANKSGLLLVQELELYVDNDPSMFNGLLATRETYVPRVCNPNHPDFYGTAISKRVILKDLGVTDKWTFSQRLDSLDSDFL